MKAIAIFSGKGGVGKSTIAALLALALAESKDVILLDLDVNTPSQPVLFGREEKIRLGAKAEGKLRIVSTGFGSKKAITFTGSMARSLMRELAKQVIKMEPDVCIIDLPPGTGDAQLEVCESLKPSAFLLVVQPNQLSYEDAERATEMFKGIGVPIAGVIQNMIGDLGKSTDTVLGMPVLAHVPMDKNMATLGSSGKISKIGVNPFDTIANALLERVVAVEWHKKKQKLLLGPEYDEASWKGERPYYVGLKSWDTVRHVLIQKFLGSQDQFLVECTAEAIEKMLSHLDESGAGMFMVIKAPCTIVPLFPGEIGMAHLGQENKMHYGVPRIAYQTDEGEVVLFANEIAPVSHEEMLRMLEWDEYIRIGATSRYVPKYEVMEQIEASFSRLARLPSTWRDDYKRLGIKKRKG